VLIEALDAVDDVLDLFETFWALSIDFFVGVYDVVVNTGFTDILQFVIVQ
jgi:hypothetical protein